MIAAGPARDPGLQPERTTLAWRRTVLAVAVGSLVALRLVPAPWGPWAGGAGLVASAVLGLTAEHRGRRRARAGAGLLLAMTLVVVAAAAVALAWVVSDGWPIR
ncbi:MAG: DUF202 domain-containing protein [Saccharothrix sp.]|nr:DUF202 domain-containing protein [Saccharothrix sp.]